MKLHNFFLYEKKKAAKNCMYVFYRANGIIIRANTFGVKFVFSVNEVDTQDDIDPLIHIAEWIIHEW
jgi:hypothetical protein